MALTRASGSCFSSVWTTGIPVLDSACIPSAGKKGLVTTTSGAWAIIVSGSLRNLGYVLDQGGNVGVGRILRWAANPHEAVTGHKGQRNLIVSDGGGDDAQRLGRYGHHSVQPLDLAGPAEVVGVDNPPHTLEGREPEAPA